MDSLLIEAVSAYLQLKEVLFEPPKCLRRTCSFDTTRVTGRPILPVQPVLFLFAALAHAYTHFFDRLLDYNEFTRGVAQMDSVHGLGP